jgi:hypothetical protein
MDDVMNDVSRNYPLEVLRSWNAQRDHIFIRLSTAILIACVDDRGKAFDLEISEVEIDPFDKAYHVHCYFRIKTTGGLSRTEKILADAVRLSIENDKLKPIALSVAINNLVNLDDTWVKAADFQAWCNTRRIELGASWSQFLDQEREILSAGAKLSEIMRQQAEIPNFAEELDKLNREFENTDKSVSEFLPTLLAELAALRCEVNQVRPDASSFHRDISTLQPVVELEIDPVDLPLELDSANMAFRAVTTGYGDPTATFRNRLIEYLKNTLPNLKREEVDRIATVANPDKSRGRKKRNKE